MLYKEMQKADAHLPTGIKDGNKHNIITFFPYENTLMFALFPFMLHFPYATLHYLSPLSQLEFMSYIKLRLR